MSEAGAWAKRLRNMHEAANSWMERTSGRHEPESLEPDSSLAADDALHPEHPVSAVAWHGLLTALEHLQFFHRTLGGTQTLYPSAYFTVLRSALLGSAQAVWVLSPRARPERQRRALIAAATDIREESKVIRSLTPRSAHEHSVRQALLRRKQEMLEVVDGAAVQLGFAAGDAGKWNLNLTEIIEDAATTALDPETRDYALLLWRLTSGHVHGHAYSRLLQADLSKVATGDGAAWARSSTSLESVGTVAGSCTLLTSHAWKLWEEQRQS